MLSLGTDWNSYSIKEESGGAGTGQSRKVTGGPDSSGQIAEQETTGYREDENGLNKSIPQTRKNLRGRSFQSNREESKKKKT